MPSQHLVQHPPRFQTVRRVTVTQPVKILLSHAGRVSQDHRPRIIVRTAEALYRIPDPDDVPRILTVIDAWPPHVRLRERDLLFPQPVIQKCAAGFPDVDVQHVGLCGVDGLLIARDECEQKTRR
eukprot:scaffold11692_cov97-Isochrysis_galbana.AAC.5